MPSKTFKLPEGVGYNVIYEHQVHLNSDAVPLKLVEWCGQYCKGRWGWYFKTIIEDRLGNMSLSHNVAVMTFEFDKDAFWFSLTHGEKE